ncbi:MAG TPA: helix-turn-helix domain-containing protein [Candidatus Onthocola stercoravium]|nr:helix-turn-helix domain-containing protein [Candidatus Onthocola stercoravium]
MNEIGEALKYARESSGVSLNEASRDLDIKPEILENIEDGRTGAFKDIYELKDYIASYAKYLGLDEKQLIDEFNEYMFEYTSKIPIKEIEKTIELKIKEEKKDEKVVSPYTKEKKKYNNWVYVVVYVVIFLMIIVAIFWSVKQVTINRSVTDTISYRR